VVEGTIHHVAVSVRDVDRQVAFYRDVLGFEVEWDMDHRSGEALDRVVGLQDVDLRIVMLKGYGLRLELLQYHRPRGREPAPVRQCDPGLVHFAISVSDIQGVYERLCAAGVSFNCPPQNLRPGVWATYFRDPEGVTVEIIQYG